MDTSQYMSMFLEEGMDNLQTLNESLLQLEQEPDNVDKVNEIFRVAHTIKGMAATMGFNKMAELTHKMEDVLSEFREGELKVSQNVVTVLFKCLDTLEQMLKNIEEGIDDETPIEGIMEELEQIAGGGQPPEEKESQIPDKPDKEEEPSNDEDQTPIVKLNEYDINVIKQANDKGYHAYQIKIELSENTLLKSARAFLIFKSLEEAGEIIKSVPGTEDLEKENFDLEIDIVLLSTRTRDEIKDIVNGISEVDNVEVQDVDIKAEKENKIKEESKKISSPPKAVKPKPAETGKPKAPKAKN